MNTIINILSMFAVMGIALAAVFLVLRRVDDWVFPSLSFEDELRGGNQAVGIFLGLLVLGIFLLAGRAVGAPTDRFDEDFRQQARLQFGYQQHWTWFKGQGMTESRLNPDVCSGAGACGVMQVMPGVAVAMGLTNRFDARESIRVGIILDAQLWRSWRDLPDIDRRRLMFASYNYGIGNVRKTSRRCGQGWQAVEPCLPAETRGYNPRIERWQQLFGRGVSA